MSRAIAALAVLCLTACGSPTAPGGSSLLTGNWTLQIRASSDCAGALPANLRILTYSNLTFAQSSGIVTMTVQNHFGITAPIFTGQLNGNQLVGSMGLVDSVPTALSVEIALTGTVTSTTITATGVGVIEGTPAQICSATHAITLTKTSE